MKEFEIRPQKLFDEYLEISKRDVERFFSKHELFIEVPCPACQSTRTRLVFEKHTFKYRTCEECLTLFVSPRPTEDMIATFYETSASSRFWAERFFPETAEARRQEIFYPRATHITEFVNRFEVPEPISLADVGAGFGIFLEEIQKTGRFAEIVAIEPSIDLALCCRKKGFQVIEKSVENIREDELQVSVACSFEVLEHLFSPEKFISSMKKILKPGGLMIFTTLTISGLDLQVLWNNSKSISPPHHINFLSVEGLKILITRCGLEEIEISTPGKLDIDIICNAMKEMPDLKVPRFIEYIAKNRGSETFEQLQVFLQNNKLSSHARVVARK